MVRQAGTPNEDNEIGGYPRGGGRTIRHVNLSGIKPVRHFMSSWKRADVAVAHAAPAAYELHDLASRHSHVFPDYCHLFLVRT